MGRSYKTVLSLAIASCLMVPALALAQSSFQDELANLRSPNAKTRSKAAKKLGRSQRREALEPLTEAMRDPEVKVRKEVVRALRRFQDVGAVDGFLIGLRDEEKDVRSNALEGIIEIFVSPEKRGPILGVFKTARTPDDVDPLTPPEVRVVRGLEARLRDEEPAIRRRAAYTLGMLKAEEAVDSLVQAVPDMSLDVRAEVVVALGRIGGEKAGEALTGALHDSSKQTRTKAMEALGRMKYKPAARTLLTIYDAEQGKSMGDRALAALAQIGAPEARGVFYQNMTNSSGKRRRYAVEGLGRLDDPALTTGLIKDFLREPDPEVQLAYCFSIARLEHSEFIDRLALSLSKLDLREQANGYLVELGSPFMAELVGYLTDPVRDVRKGIIQVLMEIGDPAAIPYLEPLLGDPEPEVADRANRAIAKLERMRLSASVEPSK
jgi:HEAT repeat protein